MSRSRRCRPDSGATLIELLLTIVILGTAIVALMGGMQASAVASDYHRKQTTAQALLKNAAEYLKDQQTVAFQNTCSPNYSQLATFWSAHTSGFEPLVVTYEFWDGVVPPGTAGFSSTCSSANGLQRLTLRARSVDGRITETLQVVKRKPDA